MPGDVRSFKERLAAGERLVVFSVGRMFHPNVVHYLGMSEKFDAMWVDVEHAGISITEMESAVTAGRVYGLETFVRVPPTDYATVTRCFESGATGVMAAQINSASQAEEFVTWAKFAPRGRRGLNPLGHDGRFGGTPLLEFTERANRETTVGIQIETLGALEEVEEIAAVDGVDFLFIGPSDLSQALGVTGDFMNELCLAAVDRIAAACAGAGVALGAVTPNPDYAGLLATKGCTLISPTNDVKLFANGLAATVSAFPGLF